LLCGRKGIQPENIFHRQRPEVFVGDSRWPGLTWMQYKQKTENSSNLHLNIFNNNKRTGWPLTMLCRQCDIQQYIKYIKYIKYKIERIRIHKLVVTRYLLAIKYPVVTSPKCHRFNVILREESLAGIQSFSTLYCQ